MKGSASHRLLPNLNFDFNMFQSAPFEKKKNKITKRTSSLPSIMTMLQSKNKTLPKLAEIASSQRRKLPKLKSFDKTLIVSEIEEQIEVKTNKNTFISGDTRKHITIKEIYPDSVIDVDLK